MAGFSTRSGIRPKDLLIGVVRVRYWLQLETKLLVPWDSFIWLRGDISALLDKTALVLFLADYVKIHT